MFKAGIIDPTKVVRTALQDAASVASLIITTAVSYTHLRAHETVLDLVCRLLLEKKKYIKKLHTSNNTLNRPYKH